MVAVLYLHFVSKCHKQHFLNLISCDMTIYCCHHTLLLYNKAYFHLTEYPGNVYICLICRIICRSWQMFLLEVGRKYVSLPMWHCQLWLKPRPLTENNDDMLTQLVKFSSDSIWDIQLWKPMHSLLGNMWGPPGNISIWFMGETAVLEEILTQNMIWFQKEYLWCQ